VGEAVSGADAEGEEISRVMCRYFCVGHPAIVGLK